MCYHYRKYFQWLHRDSVLHNYFLHFNFLWEKLICSFLLSSSTIENNFSIQIHALYFRGKKDWERNTFENRHFYFTQYYLSPNIDVDILYMMMWEDSKLLLYQINLSYILSNFYLQQLRYIGFLNFRGARVFFRVLIWGEEGGGYRKGHKTHVYTFQKTKQIIY